VSPVYRFTVKGNPLPKARARGGKGHHYTPKATRDAEAWVKLHAKRACVPCLAGPVKLSLSFYRANAVPCDVDNLAKLVSDALNGLAFEDDRQVVWLVAVKAIDRANPRTEVELEEVEPAARSAA
jgi:crossover junction endodeoxyribonuclease RusA